MRAADDARRRIERDLHDGAQQALVCALMTLRSGLRSMADDPDPGAAVKQSARNRMRGIVTRVVRDTVMAQVEMQAGPFRIVSLMSREAADDLGLEPGVLAVAAVKSTNVVVEIPGSRS